MTLYYTVLWIVSYSGFAWSYSYPSSTSNHPFLCHKHKPYNHCFRHTGLCSIQASVATDLSSTIKEAYCKSLGGTLKRIRMENEEDGLLASVSVPTFAAFPSTADGIQPQQDDFKKSHSTTQVLESCCSIPGAFQIHGVLPIHQCEDIIQVCETELQFHTYSSSTHMKNNHGALQVLVSPEIAQSLADTIQPMVMNQWKQYIMTAQKSPFHTSHELSRLQMRGINRRWRIYRYQPGQEERFLPHIDAAFPPSGLSSDGQMMIWDVSTTEELYKDDSDVVSRLTLLLYLNDDFKGGCTNFFIPWIDNTDPQKEYPSSLELLESIQPKAGSVLLFPQAVGEEEVDFARLNWPLHEGSPVTSGKRGKYVIRSDVLFAMDRNSQ